MNIAYYYYLTDPSEQLSSLGIPDTSVYIFIAEKSQSELEKRISLLLGSKRRKVGTFHRNPAICWIS